MNIKNTTLIEDMPLVMRAEDLMPILQIGRNSVYDLVRSGQIRSLRIGKNIRIPRDAVIEFINGTQH